MDEELTKVIDKKGEEFAITICNKLTSSISHILPLTNIKFINMNNIKYIIKQSYIKGAKDMYNILKGSSNKD